MDAILRLGGLAAALMGFALIIGCIALKTLEPAIYFTSFSLRTLFVAMTLIAALHGLIGYTVQ